MFNGTTYPVQNKELIWGKYSIKYENILSVIPPSTWADTMRCV